MEEDTDIKQKDKEKYFKNREFVMKIFIYLVFTFIAAALLTKGFPIREEIGIYIFLIPTEIALLITLTFIAKFFLIKKKNNESIVKSDIFEFIGKWFMGQFVGISLAYLITVPIAWLSHSSQLEIFIGLILIELIILIPLSICFFAISSYRKFIYISLFIPALYLIIYLFRLIFA